MQKKASFLKRDLDARKDSEVYRARFCLPGNEKLDGKVECFLWTPFNKKYRFGQLFLSSNFACFSSHVPKLVSLVIPLKEVNCVEKSNTNANNGNWDEAIVFSMKSGIRNFVFGQVGFSRLAAEWLGTNMMAAAIQVADRDFVVEKICELLAKLKDDNKEIVSINSGSGSTSFVLDLETSPSNPSSTSGSSFEVLDDSIVLKHGYKLLM